jgi:DNA polymerase-3 subunit epsilon/exodeoxyribonuclease X
MNSMSEIVNEGKKIPPLASSIHHITNEMIQDKVPFSTTKIYEFLQKHNNNQTTLVMHNAKFDIEMLSYHGINWCGDIVDTLRVAKHLIEDCEYYALQVLRYELKLYQEEENILEKLGIDGAIIAHESLSEAIIIYLVYEYLLTLSTHDNIVSLSYKNVLIQKFKYGKYASRYIEEIALNDSGYLMWMLENIVDMDEDMRYSIVYYLGENG